jgi:hypothetical protein
LALDEHGEAAADLIVVGDQEGAAWAREAESIFGERDNHERRVSGERGNCQKEYGGYI